MKKTGRVRSSDVFVNRFRERMEEKLCYFRTESGIKKHGIVHKVFAARFYDGVRCLVASDDGVFYYRDVLEVDVH